MDRATIKEVLRDVFGRNTEMRDLGDWVGISCPLAPWTHEKGHDASPSAGVSVTEDGTSIFNCFTCHHKAPFHAMLGKYAEFSGEDLGDLIEELEEEEFLGPRSLPSMDQWLKDNLEEVMMPINEGVYMDLYEPAVGHPYLKKRGISNATARKLELLYDPADSEGDSRILFPVRGPDGLLYGFSGRATNGDARLKVRDYHGLAKAHCVLGAHLADQAEDICIVEGLVDYAVMHDMGECGCAVMHSTMTKFQAEIIAGFGKPTYLFYDRDKAGQAGVLTAAKQLYRHTSVFKVQYPDVWIENESEEEGGHWLKDPGDMLEEDVRAMKRGAELWEAPYVDRWRRRR